MKFTLQVFFAVAFVVLVILLAVWSVMWFAQIISGWMPFWALIGAAAAIFGFLTATHTERTTR